jgi:hypothetical protein
MMSKKHFNKLLLSLAFYIVAFAWFFSVERSLYRYPLEVIAPCAILAILGILFAIKSVDAKESSWIGRFDITVGLIILFLSIFILTLVSSPM